MSGRNRHAALAAPDLLIASSASIPHPPRRPASVSLDRIERDGDGLSALQPDGSRAELTLDSHLQEMAERVLIQNHAPHGAAVLLSVEDGRVLALAGRSHIEPTRTAAELCLTPWAPAASIFKIVTAAALIDAGVAADTRVCYHDGVHSVEASNLADHPRLDRTCNSLSFGLAKSQNAIFARLAHDRLDRDSLLRTAHGLGFGVPIPFDAKMPPSTVDLPTGGLPLARAAAGFWQSTLSPLHGAYLAATIARGGVTPPLRIVDRIVRDRDVIHPEEPEARRVLDEATARAVGAMMAGTASYGTARSSFGSGVPAARRLSVAGKTGSLNRKEAPLLAYSWFVGYAPVERPEVAVAVLLGNGSAHDPKAHRVARQVLEGYFSKDFSSLLARR